MSWITSVRALDHWTFDLNQECGMHKVKLNNLSISARRTQDVLFVVFQCRWSVGHFSRSVSSPTSPFVVHCLWLSYFCLFVLPDLKICWSFARKRKKRDSDHYWRFKMLSWLLLLLLWYGCDLMATALSKRVKVKEGLIGLYWGIRRWKLRSIFPAPSRDDCCCCLLFFLPWSCCS